MSAAQPEPWPSTKALTVYNVLRIRQSASLSLDEITAYLREHWDPQYPQKWVTEGAAWLAERNFVSISGYAVSAAFLNQRGVPVPLVRTNQDRDLKIAS